MLRGIVRAIVVTVGAIIAIAVLALATWRLAVQRVNLVIVNASGAEAQLTWQPVLLAAEEALAVGGCESTSLSLAGGQHWRLQATSLDINANFVDRSWQASMVRFVIWLEPGGGSRIEGPTAVDRAAPVPNPEACAVAIP